MDIELSDIIHAIQNGTPDERVLFLKAILDIPLPLEYLGPIATRENVGEFLTRLKRRSDPTR